MSLIAKQNNVALLQIRKQKGILTFLVDVVVKFLDCREFYLDSLRIAGTAEHLDFLEIQRHTVNHNIFLKKIFAVVFVYKIRLSFSKNRILVHKENKIAEALLVIVKNQSRHNQRFSASCRHIEHKMVRRQHGSFFCLD